ARDRRRDQDRDRERAHRYGILPRWPANDSPPPRPGAGRSAARGLAAPPPPAAPRPPPRRPAERLRPAAGVLARRSDPDRLRERARARPLPAGVQPPRPLRPRRPRPPLAP